MEVWDVKNYKFIFKLVVFDFIYFVWCLDGEYILIVICVFRLWVNNGYKIWYYIGFILYKYDVLLNVELW